MIGVDAGGTSTRARCVALDGTRLGVGRSGGANPHAHSPQRAAEQLGIAITHAMDGLDPADLAAMVIGLAGRSALDDPTVANTLAELWTRLRLAVTPRIVNDYEVGFAAATTASSGSVLVAGTGSVAARIIDYRAAGTSGGWGWLLGDEGSAFWLGRAAVRATLRNLQVCAPKSPLCTAVLETAELVGRPADTTAERLIRQVNATAPIALSCYAAAVTATAADPLSAAILHEATRHLIDLLRSTRAPEEDTPIVLLGGLIGPGGPLSERVGNLLRRRFRGTVLRTGDGAQGAVRLALLQQAGELP
ncbi:MAG: N-acetylglucosamine kinase [Sciscionella sp.]